MNQCSGNSRGFFTPRVAGGQLGNGAMGNARWKGVALKAVLDKAGVQRGRTPGDVQRPRRTDQRQDPGLRQGARHRPRPRRRGDARLRHERPGSAGTQRLPPSARRARLLRHLLGQAPQRNHRHRRRVRRLLDEDGLSHSGQRLRLRRARHGAEGDHSHQPPRRAFVHHQRHGRREGESRQRDSAQRHRIRRRLRHHRSRGLDRRRKELGGGDARRGPRQIFLPRMAACR